MTQLPTKIAEFSSHHHDSRNWDKINFRDGDIVIGTYGKSGTTWMQQIIRNLLHDIPEDLSMYQLCPWVDLRLNSEDTFKMVESFNHRRFFKHHLAVENLTMSSKACYIYIGRDGRDVLWSLYNHHKNHSSQFYDEVNSGKFEGNKLPIFKEENLDTVSYFNRWLKEDCYPYWDFWHSIKSWWKIRDHPRVLICHYQKMRNDPEKEINRIYEFIKKFGIVAGGDAKDVVDNAVEKSSFTYMKKNADRLMAGAETVFTNGAESLINKGTNRRWEGILPESLSQEYEEMAIKELGEDCAHWLKTGEDPTGQI